MATHVDFQETNTSCTIDGVTFPVWVQPYKLGKQDTIEIVSGWKLSDDELAQVNQAEGVVFVTFIGAQPPMSVVGADALEFEGQNAPYSHPDCFTLATDQRDVMWKGQKTIAITSAWQLCSEQLLETNRNGGAVFLRTIGGLPPVQVNGFNPIQ